MIEWSYRPITLTASVAPAISFARWDWVVLGGYAALLVITGWWTAKRNKSADTSDYFLGGRRMPAWAVTISFVATTLSAATFIGGPEQAFRGNLTYLSSNIGNVIAALAVAPRRDSRRRRSSLGCRGLRFVVSRSPELPYTVHMGKKSGKVKVQRRNGKKAAIAPTRKALNRNLHAAKATKQDEFYTQLPDIEKELKHYAAPPKNHFKGKTVLCNCDDPKVSNFFHYFSHKFHTLKLKKLSTTCYQNADPNLFSKHDLTRAPHTRGFEKHEHAI